MAQSPHNRKRPDAVAFPKDEPMENDENLLLDTVYFRGNSERTTNGTNLALGCLENQVMSFEDQNSTITRRSRLREHYPFKLEFRCRWNDNDMYGHMNNANYFLYIDSIINTYLIEECGLRPQQIFRSEIQSGLTVGLVVSSFCNYYSSVAFPSVLELGLRVTKLGTSSVTYEVGIFEEGIAPVKAVGGYTHVFVKGQSMGVGKPEVCPMENMTRVGLSKLQFSNEDNLYSIWNSRL
ncbi:hypothetical protein NPX13_g9381 [Xylaria arbuscula]|uniref:Thioesterase domain-containing protein n=1 Tax=Xylaria arbuscula TaxID=114810 RepID=A0A9W8THI9_9PEZI|nr:hypothetical protein NPX13_g9381 [Xylaria arbuscula]